ncbi:MAG: AAA family ATPase [Alphaproteobacteria bacterium]|nr:AAA family ATPase [Alphaproteobacteria bacterium SS10]
MIIAAVGMPGSGKSVFSEELRRRGLPIVYFGGLVLQEVRDRGLPATPENERAVREELREKHGMDAMAQLALPKLRTHLSTEKGVGIDGLYSFSEYKTLRAEFGEHLVLVGIVAPRSLRHQRLAEREVRPLTFDEARQRDIAEIEKLEKGGPIAIAEHYIHNHGDLDDFISETNTLLDQLLT